MLRLKPINSKLRALDLKVTDLAKYLGLDPFDILYKMGNADAISRVASCDGFEKRYPHWRFGMQYNQFRKSSTYGLNKIYELVVNTDPSIAYLLDSNTYLDQKLVMAHVCGHSDFFKNNMWFAETDRSINLTMEHNSKRIRKYIERFGIDTVESFIDTALSLENLICTSNLFQSGRDTAKAEIRQDNADVQKKLDEYVDKNVSKYVKTFLNKKPDNKPPAFPKDKLNKIHKPERDILSFLVHNAPLTDWQSDVLSIIREEAYYFLPQRMTKIMNEGWASYWHSEMLTKHLLTSGELFDFAKTHAGVMQMTPQSFNPYKVGIELMRDIKSRWDKGHYGLDYLLCDDIREKDNWDTKEMSGDAKILEVRKIYNDVTFIQEFLTEDFCKRAKLFVSKRNRYNNEMYISTKDFKAIRSQLVKELTNFGQPIIEAVDSNYNNEGALLLEHKFEGVELDEKYTEATLVNLFKIWKRPVYLKTTLGNKEVLLEYNSKSGFQVNGGEIAAKKLFHDFTIEYGF